MKTAKYLCGAFFAMVLPILSVAEDTSWLTDFEVAKKLAAEKNCPILANFSGSDWCGWCIKLNREVFSKDEFKTYARDKLVLFVADFPRAAPMAPETAEQNRTLATTYKVQGFPTVFLLDSDGSILATTGYRPGGAEAYVEYLKGLLQKEK